jgi:hypothetical protein
MVIFGLVKERRFPNIPTKFYNRGKVVARCKLRLEGKVEQKLTVNLDESELSASDVRFTISNLRVKVSVSQATGMCPPGRATIILHLALNPHTICPKCQNFIDCMTIFYVRVKVGISQTKRMCSFQQATIDLGPALSLKTIFFIWLTSVSCMTIFHVRMRAVSSRQRGCIPWSERPEIYDLLYISTPST